MPTRAARTAVAARAGGRCEDCRLPDDAVVAPFEVDHVRAKKHGGGDDAGNLAWSCFHCNSRKGPNPGGFDPATDRLTPLYDPRTQNWDDHFRWDGFGLIGLTPEGRTTVAVLELNAAGRVVQRELLAEAGVDVRGRRGDG